LASFSTDAQAKEWLPDALCMFAMCESIIEGKALGLKQYLTDEAWV